MPIPGQIVSSANTLTAGIRTNFWDAYHGVYKGQDPEIDAIIQDFTSDKLTEIYAYYNSAPYPAQWVRGSDRTFKAFKSVQFSITNKDWSVAVPWHENDEQDDQTRSLVNIARDAGAHAMTLKERVSLQIATGATDSNLLESLPNAPDGVGMYSATDGGSAARYGVTGGNIVTGSEIATPEAIRTDYFTMLERFSLFQDTEGQPLLDRRTIQGGLVIFFNADNLQIFMRAFEQARTVEATATAQAGTGAAVSNVIKDAGYNVTLVPTPRITDNDWYGFLKNGKKPLFRQVRAPWREVPETMENSDVVRRSKVKSLMWDAREGYGVGPAFGTVKVNNA